MNGFSVLSWVILGFVLWVLWKIFRGSKQKTAPMYCTACGHEGDTTTTTKGSMLIELVLWLAFIVPGLVYSLWRVSSRHKTCSACGSSALVPTTSPVAIAQKKRLSKP